MRSFLPRSAAVCKKSYYGLGTRLTGYADHFVIVLLLKPIFIRGTTCHQLLGEEKLRNTSPLKLKQLYSHVMQTYIKYTECQTPTYPMTFQMLQKQCSCTYHQQGCNGKFTATLAVQTSMSSLKYLMCVKFQVNYRWFDRRNFVLLYTTLR